MARITIASLQAVIDTQAAANTALLRDIRELRSQIDALMVAQRPSRQAAKPLVQRTMRAPHQLPAHMAAARELAMRTGASVKV
jgi:hypothetical protein